MVNMDKFKLNFSYSFNFFKQTELKAKIKNNCRAYTYVKNM